ncbi:histidine phosphatase family protein [Caenimonas koreensis]|uniref:Histidine phosphatase family protein n=1 Tax=Caenimonas koreensis DSM 17982 TaxID=1121255 RepID=A0A844AUS5_9BURK|nr:histidine phosphatase family protein [Caenimonas koreensis]MRD48135.1 histidine phosphatase family protein [Caenimonas koreensis DSM 17982]
MDLILWRHAEAVDDVDGGDDLQRALTARGEKQAMRMAAWLDRHLPEGARILASPALRCEQTAMALGRKFKTRTELAPDGTVAGVLEAAKWPDAKEHVVIVGHQPVLGETVAQLLQLKQPACPIRKGAVWWFRTRERDGHQQTLLIAVQSPDTVG